ncbi:PAS domain-containing protein [uncultured Cohaesibacter sp.]|uniref:PAS domain-containing protein n=1 Tax=uncultured Cohaesibacter sp. TaxID=1002546 RepID=UPI00292F3918|nr:PAS domain-containing protein [uncultured Cohaesibacter sp.]
MTIKISPTGIEKRFGDSEILVSRTDKTGHITYCNAFFRDFTGYESQSLLGQPHSCMRHPDMPRAIFKIIWDTLEANTEAFAYVQNLTTSGDHYWCFAHMTPLYDDKLELSGYQASRRVPNHTVVRDTIEPLYQELRTIETKIKDKNEALQASTEHLETLLKDKSTSYRNFILSL